MITFTVCAQSFSLYPLPLSSMHHTQSARQQRVAHCSSAVSLLVVLLVLSHLLLSVTGGCLNGCSGHGTCPSNSTFCHCEPNYLASDCSIAATMRHITVGRDASFTFYWSYNSSSSSPASPAALHCRLIADTNADNFYSNNGHTTHTDEHGWAALMFGAQDGMTNGKLIRVGWNTTANSPIATSMHSRGFRTPDEADASFVSSYTGGLTERGLDVSFTIADVGEVLFPYTASSVVPVSWAWSTVLSPMSVHQDGTHGRLRVVIDEHRVVDQQSMSFYNAVAVGVTVAVVLGLLMRLPIFKYSIVGQCCLHRRLPSIICCRGRKWRRGAVRLPSEEKDDHLVTPSKSSSLTSALYHTLSLLSFDLMDTLLGWSFGELVLVALYFACLLWFVVQSYESFQSFAADPKLLLGHLTSVHLALSLLPVTRSSVFHLIFSMPYERAVAYHRYCSRLTYLFICLHGYTMITKYHLTYRELKSTKDLDHGDGVVWGTAAFVCITAMVVTSLAAVRRQKYELFYYVHLALFMPAVTFAAKHSNYFRYWLIVPLALLLIDYARSLLRTHGGVKLQRARLVQGERDRVALLTLILPNWHWAPGNYLMLYAPGVSLWQWHPYSVCGYRRRDTGEAEVDVCVLDSGSGTWSAQLYDLLAEKAVDVEVGEKRRKKANGTKAEETDEKREIAEFLDTTDDEGEEDSESNSPTTNVSVDSRTSSSSSASGSYTMTLYPSSTAPLLDLSVYGPCGHLSFNPLHYSTLVFVAGGVGITPCVPLIQHLLALSSSASSNSSPPPFVYLIWTSRNHHFLTSLFPSLLAALNHSSRAQLLLFDSSIHVQPGHVAKRRRVALEGLGGGEEAAVDVYEGRPNVRRLMEWVDRETASGQQQVGDHDAGQRRGREIEMVVQQQTADRDEAAAEAAGDAGTPAGEDELSLDSLEEDDDEHDGATGGGGGYRERVERAVERAVGVRRGVGCVVCGPSGLISEVESGCNALGWDLHAETFLL